MPGQSLVFVPGSVLFYACESPKMKIRVMTLSTLLTHYIFQRYKRHKMMRTTGTKQTHCLGLCISMT